MNKRAWLILVPLLCAACRRDMQQQPKYMHLERTWFFQDGRTARPIPAGTISLDEANVSPSIETGMQNGADLATIPMPVTLALLARGRERFDIYCSPCHGRTGNGDGMIAQRGFRQPANLNSDDVRTQTPGHIYQVITNGYKAMAGYAYQIKDIRDRWAIVAYIRALELSRHATLADAPPKERQALGSGQ